jgi:hypothetical protein
VFTKGLMGCRPPNIDRNASEGMLFTDYYSEQSCTAGRASFITGQYGLRTGLTKVGLPGATPGMRAEDPNIPELLKPLGYVTGQFGKNDFGDRDELAPTMHGFDEFFGNLYHLKAEEEPELPDYPPAKDFPDFKKKHGPRGVLRCHADGKGSQTAGASYCSHVSVARSSVVYAHAGDGDSPNSRWRHFMKCGRAKCRCPLFRTSAIRRDSRFEIDPRRETCSGKCSR